MKALLKQTDERLRYKIRAIYWKQRKKVKRIQKVRCNNMIITYLRIFIC
ncbi:MAG: hypothetical protein MR409_09180 [Lachnospiraceae bacterium]|nr:hypothetical protein [Lachnospiraceae bacterium]